MKNIYRDFEICISVYKFQVDSSMRSDDKDI